MGSSHYFHFERSPEMSVRFLFANSETLGSYPVLHLGEDLCIFATEEQFRQLAYAILAGLPAQKSEVAA